MDPSIVQQSQPRTLLLVLRPTTSFMDGNPGSGGLVVLALMLMKGGAMRDEYSLVDPSIGLGTDIAKAFALRYDLQLQTVSEREPVGGYVQHSQVTRPPPPPINPPRPAADLILEVITTRWALETFPPYLDHYRAMYGVTVTMTDSRTGRVLAKGNCVGNDPSAEAETAPRRRDMLANGATLMKSELARAANRCLDQYRASLFRLSATPPGSAPPSPISSDGGTDR